MDKKGFVTVKGFSRQQDIILAESMDLVTRNASREELLQFFIAKFMEYSTCTCIFAIEAMPPAHRLDRSGWRLKGLIQEGIQPRRWQNYCDYLSKIQNGEHWIVYLETEQQDEALISRVWASDPMNQNVFEDIRRIADAEKSSWASILRLPTPSALYPSRLLVVTYEAGQSEEDAPRGGEQDWRLLMLFRQVYNLSLFSLRRQAKRIIDHRKELLRDLAPSIIHHEINSRVINSKRALDLMGTTIANLSRKNISSLKPLFDALNKDITFTQRITHALMGLERRAKVESVFLKQEFELLKDLTVFRLNKIGGVFKNNCPDDLKINTDSALLLHILVNLMNNAIDAMTILKREDHRFKPVFSINIEAPIGNEIVAEDKVGATVLISNNGSSIEPEVATRIFEIGYTTKRGGHGLGLPISRLVVGFLGGTLELADNSGEQGTTFKLWLPQTAPATEDIQHELEAALND